MYISTSFVRHSSFDWNVWFKKCNPQAYFTDWVHEQFLFQVHPAEIHLTTSTINQLCFCYWIDAVKQQGITCKNTERDQYRRVWNHHTCWKWFCHTQLQQSFNTQHVYAFENLSLSQSFFRVYWNTRWKRWYNWKLQTIIVQSSASNVTGCMFVNMNRLSCPYWFENWLVVILGNIPLYAIIDLSITL